MKGLLRFLSYVLVAVMATALTLVVQGEPVIAQQGKLDQLSELIEDRFIGEADMTAVEDAAAEAMVEALGDRWSYYIPADEYGAYQEQMNNAYVGVGITITVMEDGTGFLVKQVTRGGPAEEAGILAGDVITGVGGVSVTELGTDEAKNLIRGEEGTTVDLTVNRAEEELTITVERRTIQVQVAVGTMLPGNVGLVTIENFDERCSEETIAAVEELMAQGAGALIFDIRNNPGGYKRELVEVLDYLLPEGPLFRSMDYAGRESVDESDAACITLPMAVLVNGESYSAAEFFAAAIREYEAGFVVGTPTCGKGYFQVTTPLNDGSAVSLSMGKYFTPNGVSLADEGGLVPDITVEVDDETFSAIYAGTLDPMEDPQIQAALQRLTGQ